MAETQDPGDGKDPIPDKKITDYDQCTTCGNPVPPDGGVCSPNCDDPDGWVGMPPWDTWPKANS